MTFSNLNLKARQQGAATLLVVMVLAIVMAVVSMTTARTGLMEQKIVGNDLRAREAQEAAEAGLEYGVAWAGKNKVPWPTTGDLNIVTCPTSGCPALPQITGSSTGETYNISSLKYFRPSTSSEFIGVTSISQGVNDTTITAQAQDFVKPGSILSSEYKHDSVPFVVNGCVSGVGGNPATHTGNPAQLSVITSQNASCVVKGDFNKTTSDPWGGAAQRAFTSAWSFTFSGLSLTTAKAWAEADSNVFANNNSLPDGPAIGRGFYVVNDQRPISGNSTYGSSTKPVVIIFPPEVGCPQINGNITVYGFVYYETGTPCSDQGWGRLTIHGGIIGESDITKVTATSDHYAQGQGSSGIVINSFDPIDASRVPGTWKDF
jgi:hypothetical protein